MLLAVFHTGSDNISLQLLSYFAPDNLRGKTRKTAESRGIKIAINLLSAFPKAEESCQNRNISQISCAWCLRQGKAAGYCGHMAFVRRLSGEINFNFGEKLFW